MEADMATIAAQQQAKPQALSAAGWRALVASFLGWLFDGYETYALILVAAVALRQLLEPQQLASLPIYIGGLLAVTLVGWARHVPHRRATRPLRAMDQKERARI